MSSSALAAVLALGLSMGIPAAHAETITFNATRSGSIADIQVGGNGSNDVAGTGGAVGDWGNLKVDGNTLNVTNNLLVGGKSNDAIADAHPNTGGEGTVRLINNAILNVGGTFQIGSNGSKGGSGSYINFIDAGRPGATGAVDVESGSTINIGTTGHLILGGVHGVNGTYTSGGNGGTGALNLLGNLSFGSLAIFTINENGSFNIGGATAGGGAVGSISGLIGVTNNGAINFNQTNNVVFSSMISGSGRVSQNGSGITTLSGVNSYSGGTSITGGILRISLDSNLGLPNGGLALSGGGRLSVTGSFVMSRATTLGVGGGEFDISESRMLTMAGPVSGEGGLTKLNLGTLVLSANNTYTGGTTVSGGTLQIGAAGLTGSIQGNVSVGSGALLAFNRMNSLTFSGDISGAGAVEQRGVGTTILTGNNSYTGGTTISIGTLQIGDGVRNGSISGDIVNRGMLAFNPAEGTSALYSGAITGIGAVSNIGPGTTILTGNNTYTGETRILAGTLQLGDNGTPQTGAGGPTGSISGNVYNAGTLAFSRSNSLVFGGMIYGSGSVAQIGSGITTLTGMNSYSGGTVITGGILRVSFDSNLGDPYGTLSISNGGTLATNRTFSMNRATTLGPGVGIFNISESTALLMLGRISGEGGLAKINLGSLVLAGMNDYRGATEIQGGTLRVDESGGLSPHSSISIGHEGTLHLNGTDQTIPGLVNAGTIVMGSASSLLDNSSNGPAGGRLTVRGDYVGQGGTIRLNTYLGSDDSVSDRLVIDGGRASGATQLDISNVGGKGALTTGDGIMVVQSLNGAVTNTGVTDHSTFQLAHRVAAGAYEYALHANGVTDTNDQNWYLRTVSAGGSQSGGNPAARPEVPTNAAIQPLALQYGHAMLGSLDERGSGLASATLGKSYEERSVWCNGGTAQNLDAAVNPNEPYKCTARSMLAVEAQTRWVQSGWAQAVGGHGTHNEGNQLSDGSNYTYTFGGLKAGLDVFANEQKDGTLDKAGIYVGYGRVSSDVYGLSDTYESRKAGTVDMDVYSLGTYWTHHAPQGWYTDAAVQGTWYKNSAKSVLNETLSQDGFGIIGSLEGGYEFKLGSGWALTPQAQAVYESVSFDKTADSFGVFSFQNGESLRGRIGTRLARTWNTGDEAHPLPVTAWTRVNVWHDFISNIKTSVVGFNGENALSTPASLKGTWGEIGVGVGARFSDSVSLYVTGDYQHSLDGQDIRGWNGKAGVNVKW